MISVLVVGKLKRSKNFKSAEFYQIQIPALGTKTQDHKHQSNMYRREEETFEGTAHNYTTDLHRRTGTFGLGGAVIFLPEKITQCSNV